MARELDVTDLGGDPLAPEMLAGRTRSCASDTVTMPPRPIWRTTRVLDRHVAVKRLRDLSLRGEQARQRVLHEARALPALDHPGVAAIYDVLDLTPPARVLEYVEGTTWDEWVDGGHSAGDVLAAFERIREAVGYAHWRVSSTATSNPPTPGNLGRAIDLLTQTVGRDPGYAAAHAELGRVHWLQYRATRDKTELDAAQRALLDALTRQPDLHETRITLALLRAERGRYPEAARALHDVLASSPDDDVALRLLGEMEAQQGSVDEGAAMIARAVTLRPGSWANHRALGATYSPTSPTLALCGRTTEVLRVARGLKARGVMLSELLEFDVLQQLKSLPEFATLL